jgi:DNA-binding response OmpR family regulator
VPPSRILVVDDEPDLVWAVRQSLSDEGYDVLTAGDGLEAVDLAQRCRPDLITLDVVMPRMDGLQVCRWLRREPALAAVPILFLTVRSTVENRVQGFVEGADDYLGKPFDLRELKARIRALLRRRQPASCARAQDPPGPLPVSMGGLTLDAGRHRVCAGNVAAQLTEREYDLLHYLMSHVGQLFSSQCLLENVWHYQPGTADPGLVRWHIKNLRAKMEPLPSCPVLIHTVARQGYVLERG